MFTHKSTNILPSLADYWAYLGWLGNTGCHRLTRSPMSSPIHISLIEKEKKYWTTCECGVPRRHEISRGEVRRGNAHRYKKRWEPWGRPRKLPKESGKLPQLKTAWGRTVFGGLECQKESCSFTNRNLWIVRWRNQQGCPKWRAREWCLFVPHPGPCYNTPWRPVPLSAPT